MIEKPGSGDDGYFRFFFFFFFFLFRFTWATPRRRADASSPASTPASASKSQTKKKERMIKKEGEGETKNKLGRKKNPVKAAIHSVGHSARNIFASGRPFHRHRSRRKPIETSRERIETRIEVESTRRSSTRQYERKHLASQISTAYARRVNQHHHPMPSRRRQQKERARDKKEFRWKATRDPIKDRRRAISFWGVGVGVGGVWRGPLPRHQRGQSADKGRR